jgi:hypothetical protein
MKRRLSFLLCMMLAVSFFAFPVFAEEEDEPPPKIEVIVHYRNEHIDMKDPGVGAVVILRDFFVWKELEFGLPDLPQLGWTQLDNPFNDRDDFGLIFSFKAGYLEDDVGKIDVRRPDWREITVIGEILVGMACLDTMTLEVWVVADGPGEWFFNDDPDAGDIVDEIGDKGFTIYYEKPEGYEPIAWSDGNGGGGEDPADPSPEDPSPEDPSPEDPSDPAPEDPTPPEPTPIEEPGGGGWWWIWVVTALGVGVAVVAAVVVLKKK